MNAVSRKAAYSLPTAEKALSQLQVCKVFSTLDLAQACQQLPVAPETATVLTVDTLKGLYKVRCLPFSVWATPAIFQRFMDMMLLGIPGTAPTWMTSS